MENLFPKLKPLTSNFFFIEGDMAAVGKTLIEWETPLVEGYGNKIEAKIIHQNLENSLLCLNPLTMGEVRTYLLIQTKSNWCAFFDNFLLGTDASAPSVVSDFMKTKMMRAVYDHQRGDTAFEFSDFSIAEFGLIRSVSVTKESKWEFNQFGTPLAFEDPALYIQKPIKKRLNLEILTKYLNHFDISFYQEDFFLPEKGAILISKIGPTFPNTKVIELKNYGSYFRN